MLDLPILSISILLPLFSALYYLFISQSRSERKLEIYAVYVAIFKFCTNVDCYHFYLLFSFDKYQDSFQFVERYRWIDKIDWNILLG